MRTTAEKQRVLAVVIAALGILAVLLVFRPGDRASAGVDLADPTGWIEHGLAGEILQVNGATGEIMARVEVADAGDEIRVVSHAAGAAVLNETSGSVSMIDATLLEVTNTIDLDLAPAADTDITIYGSADDNDPVVVLNSDEILSIDTQTNEVSKVTFTGPLRTPVQDVEGRLLGIATDPASVKRLGPEGLVEVATLPDPVDNGDEDRSLVRVGAETWLLDPARLAAVEVLDDGTFGRPVCMKSSANGATAGGSGTNGSPTIVGFNPTRSIVNVIDAGSEECSEFELEVADGEFGQPVVRNGIVYLPNWTNGRIEVVELETGRRLRSLPFGSTGQAFDLEARGNLVWANERFGAFAAIVTESRLIPVSKVATLVAGAVEVNEAGDGDGSTVAGADVDAPGLRAIGNSGDQVISSGASTDNATAGDGGGEAETDGLDEAVGSDVVQPEAIGIELAGPAEPDPASSAPEPVIEPASALIANFGVSSATAKVDEVVRFTDFSSGSPTSWTWDFGDGTGAQEPNAEKSWSTEGLYVVELTVRNARGDESKLSTEVTVVARTVLIPPTADFVFDRNTVEVGEPISLESRTVGDADLLEWDLGDGTIVRGPLVDHVYQEAGVYTVSLTASNPAGFTSVSTEITVVSGVVAPQAAIGALPVNIVEGQFVTLQSVSLNEPTRLRWDLGDGTSASGRTVRHAWDSPGTYRVRLTAENSGGTDATFVDVAVTKRIDPPVSQFTQSTTEVLVGETVSFRSLSLNEPTRLIWNFGDDTSANGETTSKSWSEPGRYRVTLRATNDAGTDRTGVTITVVKPVDPPVASFSVSSTIVSPGEAISFEDTSANNPTSWNWNFGDGSDAGGRSTAHAYENEGTYTVRLTVSNEGGTSTAERTIEVKNPPSANFRWEATGRSIKFTDTSWDDPEQYSWDFGDGTTSTDRSPTHEFATGGSYEVTLVVSNNAGQSAPKTQTVTVADPPVAAFSCTANGALLTCDGAASENAVSFRWSADGSVLNTTPNQQSTTLAFDAGGRKNVTLEVTSAAGETDSVTERSPRVNRARAPRVLDVDVVSAEGDLIRLEAEFDRNPIGWEWTVDGATLVEGGGTSSPVFRVPSNGTFEGVVRASNPFGADTDDFTFEVDSLVTQAAFDWDVVEDGLVQLTNRSIATPDAEYEWRIRGDVEIVDDDPAGPSFRYPDDGAEVQVVLLVRDRNGDDRLSRQLDLPEY